MNKKLHIIVHEPFEDAANIALWAEDNSIEIVYVRMYLNENLPDVQVADMVAVMGGDMHTADKLLYPWLDDERKWLGRLINAKKNVIGICLGAQLIAEVLGGKVIKNRENEIGFTKILKTEFGGRGSLFEPLPSEFTVFEWHGDRCVIPDSVTLLAESEGCGCQAFEYNNHVLGVQFHPEYNAESIIRNIEKNSDALTDGDVFVQSRDEILDNIELLKVTTKYLYMLLDRLFLY